MTNEELDRARSDEATAPEISPADWACADWADPIGFGLNDERHGRAYAAMMARTGWTPPVVDPDLAEAREIVAQIYDVSWPERADAIRTGLNDYDVENVCALKAIKRGRALFAAEAKPGMVWVKHDGASESPVANHRLVMVRFKSDPDYIGVYNAIVAKWPNITHYAVITQPAEDK